MSETSESWLRHALLTTDAMGRADAWTVANGYATGAELMENAGAAVARRVLDRYSSAPRIHVLCGPGNNGGDGYVAARLLAGNGIDVRLYRLGTPRQESDADGAARRYSGKALNLDAFRPHAGDVVIDALFGAGLTRKLDQEVVAALDRARMSGCPIVAVDLPSGVDGDSGMNLGGAVPSAITVTFFRRKPGHLLYPGRQLCGDVLVEDIGVRDGILAMEEPSVFGNAPGLWNSSLPRPEAGQHKYSRGHAAVFSGPRRSTGAARLAAMAAQRAGSGAVTILGDADALDEHAAHLTSIMLRERSAGSGLSILNALNRVRACVLGPGFGDPEEARTLAEMLLSQEGDWSVVLDADAVTAFEDCPERIFAASAASSRLRAVLTPHEGEFARLFPDLAGDEGLSKLEKARRAAERARAVVLYKGPDTVVADPAGRAVINTNGTPALATAGSGDVLGGLIAGLLAQGMPEFEAACAGAWIHGAAGRSLDPGANAEDIVAAVPTVLREL